MTSSRAEQHKADQAKLARLLAAEAAPMVAPQPNRPAVQGLIEILAALIGQYHGASASLAATYFEDERAAAGVRQRSTVPVADPPDADQLRHSLGWATRDLTDQAVDLDAAQTRVEGAAARHALDGGRQTIVRAATADPTCRGYTRIAAPGACSFCALLATRVFDTDGSVQGVYKTRETAQRRGRGQTEDKYHDDCRCSVMPIFRGVKYEPAAHVREWARLYADSTGDVTGAKKMTAFRAALSEQRGEHAH